jgi:prepilin-type N-terminal cleavage/methylation domain-containing protein
MHSGERGFGIIEVMIASALLAGLAMASMTYFKTQSTAQKTVEKKYEVTVSALQIRTILSVPANCIESLAGTPVNGGTVPKLRKLINSSFEDVFQVNTLLPESIKIKSYTVSKDFPNLASNEAILTVTFLKGKGSLTDEMRKNIKLIITESGGDIQTCYATSTGTEIWTYGVDGTSIYYNGGYVAVGHSTPVAPLDVKGEIKVSSTGATCSPALEGTMKYNSDPAIKNMEVCDGSIWKPVGGGGTGSLTQNGWWTFVGGLTVQWGRDTVKGDNSVHTFAKPFDHACFITIVTTWNRGIKGSNGHNHVSWCNQNQFSATIELGPSAAGAGWIAIGF